MEIGSIDSGQFYRQNLISILQRGIHEAAPRSVISANLAAVDGMLKIKDTLINLEAYQDVFIIGFGKVSAAMAFEIEGILKDHIAGGCVISPVVFDSFKSKIKILKGSHPITGNDSLISSARVLEVCQLAGEQDLVLCLISGGGSALFERLPESISLNDYQELNLLLLKSGAPITGINTVRKAISLVKGGRLLEYIQPAECISLIISDVIGDPLDSIASGPTFPGQSSITEACDMLVRYDIFDKVPVSIRDHLLIEMGKEMNLGKGKIHPLNYRVRNIILANNRTALDSAKQAAERFGFLAYIINDAVDGESVDAAGLIARSIKDAAKKYLPSAKPVCLLFGGETTVTVKGNGKGGRNQELALAVLDQMADCGFRYYFASIGTDGVDGFSDASGGIVSSNDYLSIKQKDLSLSDYLSDNDSYYFLEKIGGIVRIEPYQTNVMDIMAAIVLDN